MSQHPVLILDDDERWLALHERRLKQAGIDSYATQYSSEAIEFAKKTKIKIALIDEILFVPPVFNEQEAELQRLQGRGVLREIVNYSPDTLFIFITSAPAKRGNLTEPGLWRELVSLKVLAGVIEVINKQEIDCNPEESYKRIVNIISNLNKDTNKSSRFLLSRSPFTKFFKRVKIFFHINVNVSLALFNLDGRKSMDTKNLMVKNNNGFVSFENTVNGNQIANQNNYAPEQDLVKAAQEIQRILDYLSLTYPIDTEAQKQVFAAEFKKEVDQKPTLVAKITSALKSGGKESLKQLCHHPAVDIAIAAYEGWNHPA